MQNSYIEINDKKYPALASLYKLSYDRQRSFEVGLTGLSIVQDLTQVDPDTDEVRMPQQWDYRLKVYIDEVDPARSDYGNMDDLLEAYAMITFEHVDVLGNSFTVGWAGPLVPLPIVSANMDGQCYGQNVAAVQLVRVFPAAT